MGEFYPYAHFEAQFAAWAQSRPDIRLALVVGSRARSGWSADPWSDLDLVLFTTEPQTYHARRDWFERFGPVLVACRNDIGLGNCEWLIIYASGLDVDIAPMPASLPLTPEEVTRFLSPNVLGRGIRPLLDRDGVLARLSLPAVPSPAPLDEAAFLAVVSRFWRYVMRTAKKLRRGELWTAKSLCDGLLKSALLTMIEWHAGAFNGLQHDIWYEGRFLEQWADPRAVAGLRDAFARYDAADVWRALFATMDLFRWLAVETAGRLGYAYPAAADAPIAASVQRLFTEREG